MFSPFEYKLSNHSDPVALKSEMRSPWQERGPSPCPHQWQSLAHFTTEPKLDQRTSFNKDSRQILSIDKRWYTKY